MTGNKKLSKLLSWLLRHGAVKEGFAVDEGGYVDIDEILNSKQFKIYTLKDIEDVVKENDKQRFHIRKNDETGKCQIRANQGHSFEVPKLELTPILSASEVPYVIHGTYLNRLEKIKTEGISRMNRNHIHCTFGDPSDTKVISGIKNDAQALIYLDLEKLLNDKYEFYLSANKVILSPGNKDGIIPPDYIKNIVIL